MFHVKHEDGTSEVGLGPAAQGRLRAFERLLRERAVPAGAVAASDVGRLWKRHILDSVRGAALLPRGVEGVADLGSGAGLPGIPIAIVRPDLRLTLIESRQRRAGLLELFVERLELTNVRALASRVEAVRERFDACLARALASPEDAWRLARPLLVEGGSLLCWVGPDEDRWPAGARIELHHARDLANSGPIAIMTDQ